MVIAAVCLTFGPKGFDFRVRGFASPGTVWFWCSPCHPLPSLKWFLEHTAFIATPRPCKIFGHMSSKMAGAPGKICDHKASKLARCSQMCKL